MTDIEARLWVLEHLAAVAVRESTPAAGIQSSIDRLKKAQLQLACDPDGGTPVAPPEAIPHLLAIFDRALHKDSGSVPAGNA